MITLRVRQLFRSIAHMLVSAEITSHNQSIIACSRHILYIWVLLFAHIPFVVSRTFNTTPTKRLPQWMCIFMNCDLLFPAFVSSLFSIKHFQAKVNDNIFCSGSSFSNKTLYIKMSESVSSLNLFVVSKVQ